MSTEIRAPSPQRGEVGAPSAPGEGISESSQAPDPPHRNPLPNGERGNRRHSWQRGIAVAAVAMVWIVAAFAGGMAGLFQAFGPAPLGRDLEVSTIVVDRDGKLLRAYLTSEGRWRLPATRKDVDPRFLEALLAYEDKRFFHHRGVDPLALLRAAYQLATHGRIVSGGSTLTMQVARLIEPREKRSLYAKLHEAVRALQLEWALSKDDILSLYLTLAPYGGNLEGVRAASLIYFGKEPRRLTLGEAALLVALPQSPELRRPDRFPAAAKRARDRVLDRIAGRGLYSPSEIARAKEEPVPTERKPMTLIAPHSADEATTASPKERVLHLTIDGFLQKALEKLARERAHGLGPDLSVAIVVVDNATGEVLARVASPDYFDLRRAGQVDLTRAVRSPGSALKPFIYGIGFEDGLIHPETLIEDRPIHFSGYSPENFDLTFQGTVTVRRALQQSLNTPAVAVLNEVGPSRRNRAAGAGWSPARAAEGRSARPRAWAGRRRRAADRPHHALCRARAAGHRGAAGRAARVATATAEAADRAGRSLVCRKRPARHAAT